MKSLFELLYDPCCAGSIWVDKEEPSFKVQILKADEEDVRILYLSDKDEVTLRRYSLELYYRPK